MLYIDDSVMRILNGNFYAGRVLRPPSNRVAGFSDDPAIPTAIIQFDLMAIKIRDIKYIFPVFPDAPMGYNPPV